MVNRSLILFGIFIALCGAVQADVHVNNMDIVNFHMKNVEGNGSVGVDQMSIGDTGDVGNVNVSSMGIKAFTFSNSMSFRNIKCQDSFNLGKGTARYLSFGDITAANFVVDSVTSSTPGYGSFSTGQVHCGRGQINNLDQYGTINMGGFECGNFTIDHMDPTMLAWDGIASTNNVTINDITIGDQGDIGRISAYNFAINKYEFDNTVKFINITCENELNLGIGKARYLSFSGDVKTHQLKLDSLVSTTPGYGAVEGKNVSYENAQIGQITDFGVVRLDNVYDTTK